MRENADSWLKIRRNLPHGRKMDVVPGRNAKPQRLAWRGECCVGVAQERKAELTAALASGADVELDARELSRIDGPGLQLLAAFALELRQSGRVLHWQGASEALTRAAQITGLTGLFALERVGSSPPVESKTVWRVLAVDDSASLRRSVAETMTAAGYEVTVARNGAEALELALQQSFDVVISDLTMPVMDGLTLVEQLRRVAVYERTPILVLTTEMDPEKKMAAKEAGATGWIGKPFDPEQLLATVRKVLV